MLYYPMVLLLQLGWWLALLGALFKLRRLNDRVRRIQCEGAALIVSGMFARWLVFDHTFGFDPSGAGVFSYWFSRGEQGWFFIGLLLLLLGFFLERRPRPDLKPFPGAVKAGVLAAMAAGALGAAVFAGRHAVFGLELPWDAARTALSLGFLPFGAAYFADGRANRPRRMEDEDTTMGIGI